MVILATVFRAASTPSLEFGGIIVCETPKGHKSNALDEIVRGFLLWIRGSMTNASSVNPQTPENPYRIRKEGVDGGPSWTRTKGLSLIRTAL